MGLMLFLALILVAPTTWGQDYPNADQVELFQLWNNCRPVEMIIGQLPNDALDFGLRVENIEVAVRSRLRAARIFTEEPQYRSGLLEVGVTVTGFTFNANAWYYKIFDDPASGITASAISWTRGVSGVHARDSTYVVSSISQVIDIFIDEYLRVNEEACL